MYHKYLTKVKVLFLRRKPVMITEDEELNILEKIKLGYIATKPKLLAG